jgi:hypothetical protein
MVVKNVQRIVPAVTLKWDNIMTITKTLFLTIKW